jgi:hypothetical protein
MWDDGLVDSGGVTSADPRVLVAVITRPADWEIVQRASWYRIPLAHVPRVLTADYVAFYHTAAFAELRYTISYYAPVTQYDVVRRVELLPNEPDHPRAQQSYYRLSLGPLQRLPRPIPSHRLRRVVFICTTLSRLLSAREINDLWEHHSQRDLLQHVLQTRESAAPRGYHARRPNRRLFLEYTA